jgi:hypothetical protein
MKSTVFVLVMLFSLISFAQEMNKDSSYYAEIPTAPLDYTPGAMISRMVDGLGFRYYWATEGLTEADLRYKPSADARTILNSAKLEPTDFTKEQPKMNPLEMRFATLENFRLASALFLTSDDISKHSIVFIRKNGRSEFPFWNQINGPIEDAVWHAGQVVVLRRASGNPIYPKVNVFLGKLND